MLTTSSEQREGGLVSHRRVWGPAQAVRANRTKPCVTPAIVRWKAPSIIGKAPPFAGRMWERWPWSVSNVARALQALAASLGRRSAHAPQGCPGGNEEGHPRHTGPSLEPHGPQSRAKAREDAAPLLRRAAPSKEACAGLGFGPLVGTNHAATAWECFGIPHPGGSPFARGTIPRVVRPRVVSCCRSR